MTRHRIAILGGSGFIGGYLVRDLLDQGHEIVIGDLEPSRAYPDLYRECDLQDPDQLRRVCQGCDVIYNLAAVHRDDVRPVSLYHDVNVGGAETVCQVAGELNISTIIFTSSVAVYGIQDGEPDETSLHKPFNPYGQTKSAAENVYLEWQEADPDRRALTIVRPTVVFGPDNRGNVYNLLNQIARGRFIMVGDGENRKSMAYVENVSAFLAHVLAFGPGQHVFNYVDKPDLTMNDLVGLARKSLDKSPEGGIRLPYWLGYAAGAAFDMLAFLTRRTFPVSRVRVQKFCANTVFSAGKMRHLDFTPPHDLHHALEETIVREFGSKAE